MSRYANNEDEQQVFLSSNKGWGDFCRWVDNLPAEGHEELIHLAEHGWSQNAGDLKKQIAAAVKATNPVVDVRDVAQTLINSVQGDIVVISDGTQPDSGSAEINDLIRKAAGRGNNG